MQEFELPKCGNVETYFLFGAKHKPVIVFPLTKNYEVIAVKHFRYGANRYVLEVPGGNIEGKKTIKQTAKDELEQETGYTSKEIVSVGPPIWFDPASFRVSFFPMLALDCCRVSEPKLEKTEVLEQVPPIPLRKWVEKIKKHKICDSKTIAMTMMVLTYLYAKDRKKILKKLLGS
jgi:ADP-ribose pyrophosphatase